MHVVVVGGGIAGLAAAWTLRERGAQVTLLEAAPELGGRCRSVLWHGEWLITGAMAFNEYDTNLIELSEALGIRQPHSTAGLVDLTDAHREQIVRGDERLEVDGLTVLGLLGAKGIPLREKVALGRLLPMLRRLHSGTPEARRRAALELDEIDACEHLRRFAPVFVDYVVEPTMQMFCGYEAGDYSLAWLLQSLGPPKLRNARGRDGALGWWSFEERGVGALTHAMAEVLQADAGVDLRLGTAVREVQTDASAARLALDGGEVLLADGAIVAVPGTRVSALVPELHPDQRAFTDSLRYRGHHITYFLTDRRVQPPVGGRGTERESVGLLLPTAEGFTAVSNLTVREIDDGMLVYAEMKGGACAELAGEPEDVVLDRAWSELVRVVPGAADATVLDRLLARNDEGLCAYPAGHQRLRQAFFEAPGPPRLAFAGDWLATCSVGASHRTGVRAAAQLLRELGDG